MKSLWLVLLVLFVCLLRPLSIYAQPPSYALDRLIISYPADLPDTDRVEIQSYGDSLISSWDQGQSECWHIQFGESQGVACYQNLEEMMACLRETYPDLGVQPSYYYGIQDLPNDSLSSKQWSLHSNQSNGCYPAIDINALKGWRVQRTASQIVVGVMDTGIDWSHPDLVNRIWQNLEEDADGDGHTIEWDASLGRYVLDPGDLDSLDSPTDPDTLIDDLIGWDFVNWDNDPFDDAGHGTHVSGILGAEPNNGIGIAGVCWDVQLMPLKFLDATGTGQSIHAIQALQYARAKGVHLTNNSWGGRAYDPALYAEILNCQNEGQLFVAAAGNGRENADLTPIYPAAYNHDIIVSVGAHTCKDRKSLYSQYGFYTVDLFAPGGSESYAIFSTEPRGVYGARMGTSMAAPHVTGALALMMARFPSADVSALKSRLLSNVKGRPAYAGICVSGGRLDLESCLLKESEQENGEEVIRQEVMRGNFRDYTEYDDKLLLVGEGVGIFEIDIISLEAIVYSSANSRLATENVHCIENVEGLGVLIGVSDSDPNLLSWDDGELNPLDLPVEGAVYVISEYQDSIVWFGTELNGLQTVKENVIWSWDIQANTWQRIDSFIHSQGLVEEVPDNWDIEQISDSVILLATKDRGLWRINQPGFRVDTIFDISIFPVNNSGNHSNSVQEIFVSSDDRIFLGGVNTNSGGVIYELIHDSIRVIKLDSSSRTTNLDHNISSFDEDSAGNIWIGDGGFGPVRFDGQQTSFLTELSSIYSPLGLVIVDRFNKVWYVSQGNIWFSDDYSNWAKAGISHAPLLSDNKLTGVVFSACNGVLVQTNSPLVYQMEGDSLAILNLNLLSRSAVLFSDDSCSLWVSNSFPYNVPSLRHFVEDTLQHTFVYAGGPPSHTIQEVHLLADSLFMGKAYANVTAKEDKIVLLNLQDSTWSYLDTVALNQTLYKVDFIGREKELLVEDSLIFAPGTRISDSSTVMLRFKNSQNGFILDSVYNLAYQFLSYDYSAKHGLWLAGLTNHPTSIIQSPRLVTHDSIYFFSQLPQDIYVEVKVDSRGNPWFLTAAAELVYLYNDSSFIKYTSESLGIPSVRSDYYLNSITAKKFFIDKDDRVWILFGDNLYTFIPEAAASFTVSTFTPCLGETLTFTNQTQRFDNLEWVVVHQATQDSAFSRDTNLVYTFLHPGAYEVSLFADDSTLGRRTFTQHIQVSSPLQLTLADSLASCLRQRLILPSVQAESYTWTSLNGDTLSLERGYLADTTGWVVFTATNICGEQTRDSVYVSLSGGDCILVGDANQDGRIDVLDLLHLNRAVGRTGLIKDSLTTDPVEVTGADWPTSTFGINDKLCDCFPDGVIDPKTDGEVVIQNSFYPFSADVSQLSSLTTELVFSQQSYRLGDTIWFDILVRGDSAELNQLNSMAVGLDINIGLSRRPILIKTNSALGPASVLGGGIISYRDEKRLDMAIGRIDTLRPPIQGPIMKVMRGGIVIQIEDIEDPIGLGSRFLNLRFDQVLAFNANGDSLHLSSNTSKATETVELVLPTLDLDLTAFLEGPFDYDSMTTQLVEKGLAPDQSPYTAQAETYRALDREYAWVDWVWVGLHEVGDRRPGPEVYGRSGLLMPSGKVIDPITLGPLGIVAFADSFYVAISHRNHLPVISAEPVYLADQQVNAYDFTMASDQALGFEPMIQLANGKWALIGGEVIEDGMINPSDKVRGILPWMQQRGYLKADLNQDGIVDEADMDFYQRNVMRRAYSHQP